MLICDSTGFPFYDKAFNGQNKVEPALLSGLISAMGTVGRKLFNEEIATIFFGENAKNSITIISKEIFGSNVSIYFVFLTDGGADIKKLRALCTHIWIETKNVLKNPDELMKNPAIISKIDRLVDQKFEFQSH